MENDQAFEIFCACAPGMEALLAEEMRASGFADAKRTPGGAQIMGGWPEVWRANLVLRGANRVLARIGSFRVVHMAQLDKRARRFEWAKFLKPGVPLRVETTCRRSKIYHARAATQRIETALREEFGAEIDNSAEICIRVRIEDNLCTISLDSSGELLHKRGHKAAVNKAPMRETLAALFLRACGYDGAENVIDPMCGSGTFVIEAAEMALGLAPGRARRFAFEQFAGFDASAFKALKASIKTKPTDLRFYGSDRDAGAIRMSAQNAEEAGVFEACSFTHAPILDLERPDCEPGLIIINPPYGGRIGNKKALYSVYDTIGQVLKTRFKDWRVGLITSETALAKATRLPFNKPGPIIDHGGLKVRLYQTDTLR
ncbi:MAG: class I SAM-dependent RNA methyltransferase [Alphaproteobacteria bacterium]|nr:class I SAM-dependent RNA methyltransferase [Alphaproteobacteria bacterium]